jgi:hypothetical protein
MLHACKSSCHLTWAMMLSWRSRLSRSGALPVLAASRSHPGKQPPHRRGIAWASLASDAIDLLAPISRIIGNLVVKSLKTR